MVGCVVRVVLAGLLLMLSVSAGAAEFQDHPAISRYPGSVPTRRDDLGFKSYSVVAAFNAAGKEDREALETHTVDGDLTRLAYDNPAGRSAHEIFTNYREALEKAGYRILFSCVETECGPGYASSRWGRVTGMRSFAPDMRYLSAERKDGSRAAYVAVLVGKLRHEIDVVEATEMERGLVTAQQIESGLASEGRVVLDGVLFEHDRAALQDASKPALDVIAGYLTSHPDLSVYIVGHTDATGPFDHNMALSRDRAQAVVEALVQTYGIAAARLSAHGVGPLSPHASNRDDDGRTLNRRVEMVSR